MCFHLWTLHFQSSYYTQQIIHQNDQILVVQPIIVDLSLTLSPHSSTQLVCGSVDGVKKTVVHVLWEHLVAPPQPNKWAIEGKKNKLCSYWQLYIGHNNNNSYLFYLPPPQFWKPLIRCTPIRYIRGNFVFEAKALKNPVHKQKQACKDLFK